MEVNYTAFGLKIAAISSTKLGDVNEGNLDNKNLYNDKELFDDADLDWYDYGFRNYDAQIGRFTQGDPFDQFPSQYTGIGNDPINLIDPNGGLSIDFGTIGQITGSVLGDRLLAAGAGAAIGFGIDKLSGGNGVKGAIIGAGAGFAASFLPPINIGGSIGKAASNIAVHAADIAANQYAQYASYDGGYQPLYKDVFLNYVKTTMCPNCGTGALQNMAGQEFERLFEDYTSEHPTFPYNVIKNPINNKLPGESRNTVPDYFGVRYGTGSNAGRVQVTSFYELESFFELKATKNNIGTSSFDGQLKVQIQAAKRLKVREIIIITTYGVKLTKPLQKYAAENGITLTHYWSQYMMLPNNKMKLNYTPAAR